MAAPGAPDCHAPRLDAEGGGRPAERRPASDRGARGIVEDARPVTHGATSSPLRARRAAGAPYPASAAAAASNARTVVWKSVSSWAIER